MMLSYEPWAQTRSYECVLLEMPTTQEMFCAVTLRTPPKCPRPPKKNSWLRYASPQYAHAHAVFSGCRYVTLGVMPKCCLHYGSCIILLFSTNLKLGKNKTCA